MNTSSSVNTLKPLRCAASELRDAAHSAQKDFVGGAQQARDHLQTGLTQALGEVAKSNARLHAVVDDVAAAARASAESVLRRGQDLGRRANRHFFGLRKQAVSQATDALDNTVQYSRDAGRKMQKAATDATSWASRNPRTVFAVAITACCVAVLQYRRRRKAALAAARKKVARKQIKKSGARTSTPRRAKANSGIGTK